MIGPIIGAIGGFIVGGPIGAVVGAGIGYAGFKALEPKKKSMCQATPEEFQMLGRILSKSESELRASGKSRDELMNDFKEAVERMEKLNCPEMAQKLRDKALEIYNNPS